MLGYRPGAVATRTAREAVLYDRCMLREYQPVKDDSSDISVLGTALSHAGITAPIACFAHAASVSRKVVVR